MATATAPIGTTPASLRHLRIALTMFFGLAGFIFAGWTVRIPAVKEQVGASAGTLGLALLCASVSAVATMSVAGLLCRRFGSRQVTIASALLLSVSIVIPPLAHSALTLGLGLIVFGIGYGAIDVAVNSVAVDLIRVLKRPIMPSLHAANSIGSLVGAGLGALVAPHLSPLRHMLLITPLGVATALGSAWLLMAQPLASEGQQRVEQGPDTDPVDGQGPRPGGLEAGTFAQSHPNLGRGLGLTVTLFALVALCSAYTQGALDNWVPLHITADLSGGPSIAAAGYAVVQGCLTLGRLIGMRLLERLGQTRVVVVGGLAASGGALLNALAPSIPLVFVGLVVTGLGLANIFPYALARAGELGGPNGIALASTLGYGGILLAPPTIGFLADAFGLPAALTLIAFMVAMSAVISFVVRDRIVKRVS